MKKKENNKGITLIALVITIIVMLILVVIVIEVATDGGLIEKAKEGGSLTTIEEEKETLSNIAIGQYDEKTGNIDLAEVKIILENDTESWDKGSIVLNNDILTVKSLKSKKIYAIDKNANIVIKEEKKQDGDWAVIRLNEEDYSINYWTENQEMEDNVRTLVTSIGLEENTKISYVSNEINTFIPNDLYINKNNEFIYQFRNESDGEGWQACCLLIDSNKKYDNIYPEIFGYNTISMLATFRDVREGNLIAEQIKNMIIPNTVSDMEETFMGCYDLEDASFINIPNRVDNMYGTFKNCSLLEKAPAIPINVKYISNCFSGCEKLSKVTYEGTVEQFKQIEGYNYCGEKGLIVLCSNGNYVVQ